MNKIKEIEAFVSAVGLGSLARAAKEQRVTAAMLGRRIDALERRLGVKLMHRTTRHLTLTERGVMFLEQGQKILADVDHAERLVSEQTQKVTGNLNVFAPAAFGRMHVAAHAASFVAAHPGVVINIHLTTDVVDLVRDKYDLGIRIKGNADPSLVAVKLADNRRVVCGTPAYFARHGVPKVPDDLLQHNCFIKRTPTDSAWGWHFQVNGKPSVVKVSGNMGCNDGELLTHWARSSLGLAWRSSWEIQSLLDSGELVTVLDEFEPTGYDIVAVYAPQRYLPAKIRLYIDELKAIYGQPGYWSRPWPPKLG
ncbi:MAG: LysR family transcriptional regulator [Variovorax sp.]|nr:MAG: LysR family transcriptional regulator [Variovorax sp.]